MPLRLESRKVSGLPATRIGHEFMTHSERRKKHTNVAASANDYISVRLWLAGVEKETRMQITVVFPQITAVCLVNKTLICSECIGI